MTQTDQDLLVEKQINSENDPLIRVLVVDDSNSERKLLKKELSKRGYQITEAVDATDALSKFSPEKFDVVLSDYEMPNMDGLELMKTIQERAPFVPVIILTGHDDLELAVASMREGAVDFLTKTPDMQPLDKSLVRAVRTARRERRLKQAENALRESEARVRAIVENAAEGIVTIDERGIIESFNPAAARIFDYTPQEVIGQNISLLMPSPHREDLDVYLAKIMQTGEGNIFGTRTEVLAQRRDGSEVPLELSVSEVQIDDRRIFTGILHDLTERKQAEAVVEQAHQDAIAANRAKSEFLANMSHEIRTPMNGIIGMTELALDTELTEEQREYLETVNSSADALLELINDILDFSKIEAGKLDLHPSNFDLRGSLDDTMKTLAVRTKQKGLELDWNVSPEVPFCLIGDGGRLRQIIVNLVGNAIKFTEQGRVALDVHLESQNQQTVELLFSVSDTGIGVSPEKQKAIFDPFSQADGSTTRTFGGTGLGLAISAQLTELMGGKIRVESEPGQGSRFYFTATFDLGDDTCLPYLSESQFQKKKVQKTARQKFHVLLAEDSKVNQNVVVRFLEKEGHTVVVAGDGTEALAALENNHFDFILMDVQMPQMDGMQATAIIREKERTTGTHLPIIALTAHAMKGDRERFLEAGMDSYVSKPVRAKVLLETIENVMGHSANPVTLPSPAVGDDMLFNRDTVLNEFRGDMDFLRESVEMFLKESPDLLADISNAIEVADSESLKFAAHSLKGAVSYFTNGLPFTTAQELEEMGHASRLTQSKEKFVELQDAMDRLQEELKEFLSCSCTKSLENQTT